MQRAFVSLQTEQMKFSLDSAHTVEVFATPVVLEDGSVDGVVIRVDDVRSVKNDKGIAGSQTSGRAV